MTPTQQTKLCAADGGHSGNCFAACLATLLDLPLWMVPPFEDMPAGTWFERSNGWLREMFGATIEKKDHAPSPYLPPFIAVGHSDRGVRHAVINRGVELVWDPHPQGSGLTSIITVYVLRDRDGNRM